MTNKKNISVIVPAYNEADNIPLLINKLLPVLKEYNYEIIIVNDGSKDNTVDIVRKLHNQNNSINLLSFSRNFGQQEALRAGLNYAKGDIVVSIDADLEQPVSLITDMVQEWQKGYDIVYTIHLEASHESCFKKITSHWFYHIFNLMSGMKIAQSCDFRLLDRKVVNVINNMPEHNLFLRGSIGWIGFKQKSLFYSRGKRLLGGKSRYTFKKMLMLAINGIFSFSIRPLHFVVLLGMFVSFLGFLSILWVLYVKFFSTSVISGWPSLMSALLFVSGIQLLVLGIIGEYIGMIVMDVKKRPSYIIDKDLSTISALTDFNK